MGLPALPDKRLPTWLVGGLAGYLIALKLVLVFFAQPQIDETYYWLWGQHLELSYLDHPALHAWLQGLASWLLGWNLFAMRALTLVTSGVTICVLYDWCRRLAGERWLQALCLTIALYYSSPILLIYSSLALIDRLLLVLVMLAVHCLARFGTTWEAEGRLALRWLYGGAVCLGLAVLSKYLGAVAGAAAIVVVLVRPGLRPLLRSPHLWLAAGLALAIQAPTVIWNSQSQVTNTAFQLMLSDAPPLQAIRWTEIVTILSEALILLSPFCVPAIAVFLFRRSGPGLGGMLHELSRWVFIVSSLGLLTLEVVFARDVIAYWNVLAYAAFFGLSAWFIRSRVLQLLQIGYGAVLSTLLVYHFTVFPFLDGRIGVRAGDFYGWDRIAAATAAAQASTGAAFVAADNWESGSELAFAMRSPEVVSLSPRIDAYSQWQDEQSLAGQTAVVLEARDSLAALQTRFDSLELIRSIEAMSWGRPVRSYRLYLGRGFRPVAR